MQELKLTSVSHTPLSDDIYLKRIPQWVNKLSNFICSFHLSNPRTNKRSGDEDALASLFLQESVPVVNLTLKSISQNS